MIRRCNVVDVSPSTALVAAYIGSSGCACECSDCNGCTDCTSCPNLSVPQINMVISRAGVFPVVNLFSYPAYEIVGNIVYFYVDSTLTSLNGRYIGQITVTSLAIPPITSNCGKIEMQVGNPCTVFNPFTVSIANFGAGDLQPS